MGDDGPLTFRPTSWASARNCFLSDLDRRISIHLAKAIDRYTYSRFKKIIKGVDFKHDEEQYESYINLFRMWGISDCINNFL